MGGVGIARDGIARQWIDIKAKDQFIGLRVVFKAFAGYPVKKVRVSFEPLEKVLVFVQLQFGGIELFFGFVVLLAEMLHFELGIMNHDPGKGGPECQQNRQHACK